MGAPIVPYPDGPRITSDEEIAKRVAMANAELEIYDKEGVEDELMIAARAKSAAMWKAIVEKRAAAAQELLKPVQSGPLTSAGEVHNAAAAAQAVRGPQGMPEDAQPSAALVDAREHAAAMWREIESKRAIAPLHDVAQMPLRPQPATHQYMGMCSSSADVQEVSKMIPRTISAHAGHAHSGSYGYNGAGAGMTSGPRFFAHAAGYGPGQYRPGF